MDFNKKNNMIFNIVFLLLLVLMPWHQAQAYLDPGSGSFLFQLLVGAVLSGLFAIKLYFRKIKSFFKKSKAKEDNSVAELTTKAEDDVNK